MEFVKVESSQIDSVGFGDGLYGPETLGVRFKSKSGITEYHYQNVTPRTHQVMMGAESIGKYFGANIKGNPAHSFVKVEADPTQPRPTTQATATGITPDLHGTTKTTQTQSPASEISDPGSALSLIDTMDDDKRMMPMPLPKSDPDMRTMTMSAKKAGARLPLFS